MNGQERLITIYLYVCKHYQKKLWVYSQSMSHYADLSFTDEDVITLYLFGVTGASAHDGKIFDQIRPYLHDQELYGDKAYHRPDAVAVKQAQHRTVLIPVKKQKGQQYLEAQDQWLSTDVSRVRQPIEALFAWIEEKTGIECASKVRSYHGLMVHVFGKLAAALFFWNFLRTSS